MIYKAGIIKGIDIINMITEDMCFAENNNSDLATDAINIDTSDAIHLK